MKLAVVAANGQAGSLIVKEAVERGLDVTAIARGENRSVAEKAIIKDIFDLTKEDLSEFDVIINAYGGWTPEGLAAHSTTLKHLADLVSNTDQRLLVVGGAGSLFVNPEHTITVMETPDFPEEYKPTASAMKKSLDELRERHDVKWTYVSPAGDFEYEAERTGKYILGGEELVLNSKGESAISYADYAIAMIDETVSGNHIQQRISVVSE